MAVFDYRILNIGRSFVGMSRQDCVLISKTVYKRIVADSLSVLGPIPDSLNGWTETWDPLRLLFRQDLTWSSIWRVPCWAGGVLPARWSWGLLFYLLWCTGDVIGLIYRQVHKHERELRGKFVYLKLRPPATAVQFEDDARFCSTDDFTTPTWEVLCDKQPECIRSEVNFSVPTTPGNFEGAWDFGKMTIGQYSGCEQYLQVLIATQALKRCQGLPLPEIRWDFPMSGDQPSAADLNVWRFLTCAAWSWASRMRRGERQQNLVGCRLVCRPLQYTSRPFA